MFTATALAITVYAALCIEEAQRNLAGRNRRQWRRAYKAKDVTPKHGKIVA